VPNTFAATQRSTVRLRQCPPLHMRYAIERGLRSDLCARYIDKCLHHIALPSAGSLLVSLLLDCWSLLTPNTCFGRQKRLIPTATSATVHIPGGKYIGANGLKRTAALPIIPAHRRSPDLAAKYARQPLIPHTHHPNTR